MKQFLYVRRIKAQSGFSLIELMVVVAIVAIISAVAIPNYLEHVERGARADMKAVMMENAAFMERISTENNGNYKITKVAADGAVTYEVPTLPFDKSPRGASGNDVKYEIKFVEDPTNQTYEIQATPVKNMAEDKCGIFKINNFGQRKVSKLTVDECWNR